MKKETFKIAIKINNLIKKIESDIQALKKSRQCIHFLTILTDNEEQNIRNFTIEILTKKKELYMEEFNNL